MQQLMQWWHIFSICFEPQPGNVKSRHRSFYNANLPLTHGIWITTTDLTICYLSYLIQYPLSDFIDYLPCLIIMPDKDLIKFIVRILVTSWSTHRFKIQRLSCSTHPRVRCPPVALSRWGSERSNLPVLALKYLSYFSPRWVSVQVI